MDVDMTPEFPDEDFKIKLVAVFETPKISKIIINGNVMIVVWSDGEKNRATCSDADPFDRNIGFAVCLAKRLYGKKKLAKMLGSKKLVFVQEAKK